MKVLVTGVKGQLGYDVVNELTKRGIEAVTKTFIDCLPFLSYACGAGL